MSERQSVISQAQAAEELAAWFEAMDLVPDPARMDPDSAQGFRELTGVITRALISGHLVTNEQGNFALNLKTKGGKEGDQSLGTIVFHEPGGLAMRQMDKVKGDFTKLYQYAAAITRTDAPLFDQMLERDLRVVRAIVQLFLAPK